MNTSKIKIILVLYIIINPLSLMAQASGGQIRRPTDRFSQRSSQVTHAKTTKNKTVTISEPDGYVNDHGYVDLGLPSGTKWAIFNVGANTPQEEGDKFAWGETSTKAVFNKSTYRYFVDHNGFGEWTKYCINSYHSHIDNKIILDDIDDVAATQWGGRWRTPSSKELEELLNKCIWKSEKGGWKVIGPNKNSIFVPYGGYWSNEIANDNDDFAKCLYWERVCGILRDTGQFVRPICK